MADAKQPSAKEIFLVVLGGHCSKEDSILPGDGNFDVNSVEYWVGAWNDCLDMAEAIRKEDLANSGGCANE